MVVTRKELRSVLIRLLDLSMRKMRDPKQRRIGSDLEGPSGKGARVSGKSGSGIKAKITRARPSKPANVNKAGKKSKVA